ncbi:MAG: hypothetical protein OEM29_08700 [Thermoplasmata archaeon]|nr:hypothetical protein [Thermoplasmata archaeon]
MHSEEVKQYGDGGDLGKRVFGVVLKGYPNDFQMWLDSAKVYGLYIVFSKSTRTSKLVIEEVPW